MPVATPQRNRMDADLPPLPPPPSSSRLPRTVTFADETRDYAGEHQKVEKSMRRQARRERERAIEEREEQLERLEARWNGYYAPPREGGPSTPRYPPQHARTPHPSPAVSAAHIPPYSPVRPLVSHSTPQQGMQPRRVSAPPDGPSGYYPRYASGNPNEPGELPLPSDAYRPISSSRSDAYRQISAKPPVSSTQNNPADRHHSLSDPHRYPPPTYIPRQEVAKPQAIQSALPPRSFEPQPRVSGSDRNRRVSEPLLTARAPSQAPRLLPVVQEPQEAPSSSSQHPENAPRHQAPAAPSARPQKRAHVSLRSPRLGNCEPAEKERPANEEAKNERRTSQSSQHLRQTADCTAPLPHEDLRPRPSKQRSVSTPVETVVQAIKDQSASGELHMTLDEMEEDVTCSICLQVIVAAHGMSPCGHTICGGCANEWVREKSSCPACRTELTKDAPFVPLLGMDAIISKWVRKQGENWEGLADWQERCEMWQAHRVFNEQSSRPERTQETVQDEDDPYRNWIHQDFGQLSFEPQPQPSFSGSFVDRHDRAMFDLLTGSRPSERVMREMLFPSSFAIEAVRDILHDSTRERFRDRFRHAALRIHRQLS